MDKKNEIEYRKGLPFTLDYKQMIRKSIESRFNNPTQGIIELTKLAVENSYEIVNIIDKPRRFSVEFDGEGISSEDELKSLLKDVLSSKDDDKRFNRFGDAIIAALAANPKEIYIETGNGDGTLCMTIGKEFKTVKTNNPFTTNRITVRKKDGLAEAVTNYFRTINPAMAKKDMGRAASGMLKNGKEALRHPIDTCVEMLGDSFEFILRKVTVDRDIRDIVKYTDKKVRYNKRKFIQGGFSQKNALFQKEYNVGESHILLSIPKRNSSKDYKKKITFLKDTLPLTAGFITDEFDIHKNVEHEKYVITPEIIVNNPSLKAEFGMNKIIRDNDYEKVKKDIDEAISIFYNDFLKGEFEKPYRFLSNEHEQYRTFTRSLYVEQFGGEKLADNVCDFLIDRDKFMNGLDEDKGKTYSHLFNQNLFRDITGRQYTIPQLFKEFIDKKGVIYYTKKEKLTYNHPVLVYEGITHDDLLLNIKSSTEKSFLNLLFGNKKYEFIPNMPQTLDNLITFHMKYGYRTRKSRLLNKCFYLESNNIDYLFDEHDKNMGRLMDERWKKRKKKVKKTSIIGGVTTVTTGVGYLAIPYAAWLAKFMFVDHPKAALMAFGAIGSAAIVSQLTPPAYSLGKKITLASGRIMIDGLEKVIDSDTLQSAGEGFRNRASKTLVWLVNKYESMKLEHTEARKRKESQKLISYYKKHNTEEDITLSKRFGEPVSNLEDRYLEDIVKYLNMGRRGDDDFNIMSRILDIESVRTRKRKAFRIKKIDNDNFLMYINIRSKDFKKRVRKYYDTNGKSVFWDLQDISDTIAKISFYSNTTHQRMESRLVSELHKHELKSIIESFYDGDDRFKEVFREIGEKSQRGIIKTIMERDEESSIEPWLIENYSPMLEEISQDMITEKSIDEIIKITNREIPKERQMNKDKTNDFDEFLNIYKDLTRKEKIRLLIRVSQSKKDYSQWNNSFIKTFIENDNPLLMNYLDIKGNISPEAEKLVWMYNNNTNVHHFSKYLEGNNYDLSDIGIKYLLRNTIFNLEPMTAIQEDIKKYFEETIPKENDSVATSFGRSMKRIYYKENKADIDFERIEAMNTLSNVENKNQFIRDDYKMIKALSMYFCIPDSRKQEFIETVAENHVVNIYFKPFMDIINNRHYIDRTFAEETKNNKDMIQDDWTN